VFISTWKQNHLGDCCQYTNQALLLAAYDLIFVNHFKIIYL